MERRRESKEKAQRTKRKEMQKEKEKGNLARPKKEDVHCVGLSILSGSHLSLVPAVLDGLRAAGMGQVPVVVGGIIPAADAVKLRAAGVAEVFTPQDYDLNVVIGRIVEVIRRANGLD